MASGSVPGSAPLRRCGPAAAAVGISSVVRTAVTRRWREFGVRLALGATRGHVVSLAVRKRPTPVVAGLRWHRPVLLTARLLVVARGALAPHDLSRSSLRPYPARGLDAGRMASRSTRVARRSRSRLARHVGSSGRGKVRGMSRLLIIALAVLASAGRTPGPPTGSASPCRSFPIPRAARSWPAPSRPFATHAELSSRLAPPGWPGA